MKKRVLVALLATALTVSMMTGCGSKKTAVSYTHLPELSENARSRKGKAVLSEEESANDTAAERKRKSDRTD